MGLYLTPNSIPLLAKFILTLIVTVYVLFFTKKDWPARWFCGYLVGYAFFDFFLFSGQSIIADWAPLSLPGQYFAALVLNYCFLVFAYLFKHNTLKKERRWAMRVFGFLSTLGIVYTFIVTLKTGYGSYESIPILLFYLIFQLCWSASVFLRKHFVHKKNSTIPEVHSSPNLSFFILTVLAIFFALVPTAAAYGLISNLFNTIAFFTLNLIIFVALTITFINHLATRTTVLVKIVGISLVLILTIIGLQALLILPQAGTRLNHVDGYAELDSAQKEQLIENRQPLHLRTVPYAWFLFGSAAVILIGFPAIYTRSVLRPLNNLLNGVRKVEEGELAVEIPITNKDEIGYVTRHFNDMTESLQKANSQLTEYTENLEEKVERRTQKLNIQNEVLADANKKLEEQTEELARMDRFRSQLFMNISHELRTPITLISGPLQKLLKQKDIGDDIERQLTISLRNTGRLRQLVEQILDLNRLETNQLTLRVTNVDINTAVQFLASSFQSLLQYKGIEFDIGTPDHPVEVFADPDKLEKIITNLLSNAAKFTPRGGFVHIELIEKPDYVAIQVSDTGRGIEPDRLETIFDRFQTIASEEVDYREGLGIGLAITKEYVELLGGTIGVESSPGSGTLFKVRLKKGSDHFDQSQIYSSDELSMPVTIYEQPYVKDDGSGDTSTSQLANGQAHILVVEDNRDMSVYIKDMLGAEGYFVSRAENGQEALKMLEDTRPDLIISDIMMPVMDGMAFLKELKKREALKNIPTIFLSARSDAEGRLQGLRLGINDYLVKPFDAVELLCRIANLLQFSIDRKKALIELSDEDSPSADEELITKVTQLVEERITNTTLTMEELAHEMAMSRRTLYRELKKATGLSAAAFVREVKLLKARQKLENGTVTRISELSMSVGFSTSSYFSKVYFKRFGKNPSDFLGVG